MKPYEVQVYTLKGGYPTSAGCVAKEEKPAPKKQVSIRRKMGKKELEYTAMLEDLYHRAEKVKPEELDAFIAEVKEKLPGYPKRQLTLGGRVMKQRYVNGMHASALAGIAAMASV
jgi:hypothetical protein